MDCSLPGSSLRGILRQGYWSGLAFSSLGDLPNPGPEPRSPALQAYSLPSEPFFTSWGLPLWFSSSRICLQCERPGSDPWVGKIPWRRERLSTPVFWPGEFHGWYSPWSCKESDTTEWFSRHFTSLTYQLSHKGSPEILEWVAYPFSSRSSLPRNWTGVSSIAGRFLVEE